MKRQFDQIAEADLHCHTSASDGLLTPGELVELAWQKGLRAVAITDHDTISGWSEAELTGGRLGVEVLRGVELNTVWEEKEVHILGYELDGKSKILQEQLTELQESRFIRISKILKLLRQSGFSLAEEDVLKFARGESVGRPHIAQALVEKGYLADVKEAFDRYLGFGAPAYVPRLKLNTTDGIRLIREAKGVAVLAHPGLQRLEKKTIASWIKFGLQGIEVNHSDHNRQDQQFYGYIASQYHLLMTGGSDFHGDNKPSAQLGQWGVSMEVVRQLRGLENRKQVREEVGN